MAVKGPWREGMDGSTPVYAERLRPPALVWLLLAGFALLIGVAYGAAYGAVIGLVAGAGLAALGASLLLLSSTPIRVDDAVVRAGRARLPLSAIAEAIPLDTEAMRHARRHGDGRDYLVLRAWSSSRGVSIVLDDDRDPHPRWVVTSRRPQALAEAINAVRANPGTPADRSG